MNEAIAYKWAAQATRRIDGIVESYIGQQLPDSVVAAILAAYKQGKTDNQSLELTGKGRGIFV